MTAPATATDRLGRFLGEPWLVWLLSGFMLTSATVFLLRPMISYRALALGVEPASLGLVAAAFSIAPLLVALRIGRLVDRHGEKWFVIAGNAVMAVCLVVIATLESVASLVALSALLGLAHISAVVAVQGMVARGSDESNYDRRFVAFSFSGSLGQLLGPAVGGLVAGGVSVSDTSRALFVGAGMLVAVIPLALMIRPPSSSRRERAEDREMATGSSLLGILRTPGVARAIVVGTTVISAIDILTVYMPAIGEDRAWSVSLVGGLLALRAAASLGMRFVLGGLVARFGRGPMLAGSMVVSAAGLLLMPLVGTVPLFALLIAATGAGLGIGQPLSMAWVASLAAPRTQATALAIRLMGNRLGQVVVPVAAGGMAAFGGAAGVLSFTGVIVGISLAGVFGGVATAGRVLRRRTRH